jgi:hypothetical protein
MFILRQFCILELFTLDIDALQNSWVDLKSDIPPKILDYSAN